MTKKIISTEKRNTQTLKRKRYLRLFSLTSLMMFVAIFTWQCKQDDFTGETIGVCPEVISTDPANGAINVVTDKKITATFNEAMNPSTINSTTYVVRQGANLVSGTVTYSDSKATFTPTYLLAANTVYTATITTGSKDPDGNSLRTDYVWSFNTGNIPVVILTDPTNGASEVPFNKLITATFSTPMNALTINAATYFVKQGTTLVPGVVSYAGVMAIFTPTSKLLPDLVYTATVTKGAKDVLGNAIAKDTTWSFATSILPAVVLTDPKDGDINVSIDKKVTATFNKIMSIISINTSTFTLMQGLVPISGSVTYSGKTATFTPDISLLGGTEYTAKITTGALDLIGNALPKDTTWKFTTTPKYSLTLSSNPTTGGTTSGQGLFFSGTLVIAKAVSNTDYTFTNWTEGTTIVSTDANYSFLLTKSRALVANFTAVAKYTVSLSSNPILGGTTTGQGTFFVGTLVSAKATPNVDYTFTNWTEGTTIVSTDPNYSFMLTNNRTLVANFTAMSRYTVSLSSNPLAGGTTTGQGTFLIGTLVIVKATPNTDYIFNNWTEGTNIVSTDANYSFLLSNNRTLVANFTSVSRFTVSLSANPLAGGTTTGQGTFVIGTLIIAKATPNIDYTFKNWTEGTTIVSTDANYSFLLTNNRTLVANFTSVSRFTVSLSANPLAGGTTTGQGTFLIGTLIIAKATPNIDYIFKNWTEGTTIVSTDANYSFLLTNNRTLVANFTAVVKYNVSLSANPLAGGTTTGGGIFNEGTFVTATASQNSGYKFTNWTEGGNAVSTDMNYSFLVNSNRTLVANFTFLPSGPLAVDLGCAAGFAILAGSTVTSTGPSIVSGDLGLSPGTAVTGFPPASVINGAILINTTGSNNAKGCLTAAYIDLMGRSLNAISLPGQLGGLTLAPGLYSNSSTSGISGTGTNGILTLDAGGNPNAVWIFQIGSTLITDPGTSIVLAGGALAKNIFWGVGTSATLGTNSVFYGNILAQASITLNTGAILYGRALTQTAAISLDASTITKP